MLEALADSARHHEMAADAQTFLPHPDQGKWQQKANEMRLLADRLYARRERAEQGL